MTLKHKAISIDVADVKVSGDARKFSGYASTFNGVDSYGDTVLPGAYKDTISNRSRPVAMRWNHYGPVIGKWTAMHEDEKGLFVEGELTPGHSVADDAYALLKHGAINGLSIGYRPVIATSNDTGGENLKQIDLIEISVVESPADLGAQIGNIKAAIDSAESLKEVERLLRDATGLSRADATALVSRIKYLALGDQVAEDEIAAIAKKLQSIQSFI